MKGNEKEDKMLHKAGQNKTEWGRLEQERAGKIILTMEIKERTRYEWTGHPILMFEQCSAG